MSSIVVGFRDRPSSLAALQWAISVAKGGALPLRVVHASSDSIAVLNGPSSAIAHQLGNPPWATVHSLVQGLGAHDATETIVQPGAPEKVLTAHIDPGDIVVLGKRRWWPSKDLKKKLESSTNSTVIRISEDDPNNISLSELSISLTGARQ